MEGLNMKFKHVIFESMFRESQRVALTKDPYIKLVEFESKVIEVLTTCPMTDAEKLEGHKLLQIINAAQIMILENKMGKDLNGDGRIG